MFVCLQMFVGSLSECLSTDLMDFIAVRGGKERGGHRGEKWRERFLYYLFYYR